MNLPTFSSSDLQGEGATSPSVIPAIGIFAATISPDVKPIFVIDGTELPCLLFENQQTSADDLQFYIQWDGMLSEYSSLEPYAFIAVKGRRHSVGETSVVQQYLADNNIDAYKTTNTTDALPLPHLLDPSEFIPDDHAPVPSNSAIVDFQPNDVAYSRASNDYVIVLQRLNAGTTNELYSIRRRDGFTLKVSKSTLLHPAEAARLNLEPSPELPWDAEHAEPTIIEEPTAPKKKSTPVVKPPPVLIAAVPKPAKTVTYYSGDRSRPKRCAQGTTSSNWQRYLERHRLFSYLLRTYLYPYERDPQEISRNPQGISIFSIIFILYVSPHVSP